MNQVRHLAPFDLTSIASHHHMMKTTPHICPHITRRDPFIDLDLPSSWLVPAGDETPPLTAMLPCNGLSSGHANQPHRSAPRASCLRADQPLHVFPPPDCSRSAVPTNGSGVVERSHATGSPQARGNIALIKAPHDCAITSLGLPALRSHTLKRS